MKNITIKDIADHAKVSKATVSRVLNNPSAVHRDKRHAVLAATKKLGFKPNIFARSLAGGRSMTIGIVTQNIGSAFCDAVSQGVIAGLTGTGFSPIFVDGQWQRSTEIEGIQALLGRRVDGMVFIGGDIPSDELTKLCANLPTVVVAREVTDHPCVFIDNVEGGYRATKHLIDYGHRKIAIIGGLEHHSDAIHRYEGYEKALAEVGIEVDSELVCSGDFTAQSGVLAVNALVARNQPFTAIFAANDMSAFGARLALHRHGLRVPDDVSIVGFDDQPEAAFMTPPLTTVRQPGHEMGVHASETLLQLIDGKTMKSNQPQAELRIRESVRRIDQP